MGLVVMAAVSGLIGWIVSFGLGGLATGVLVVITIEYDGREHVGTLQWDAPPKIEDVEKVLRANIGRPIRDVGDQELLT